jgi:hypothetical protein
MGSDPLPRIARVVRPAEVIISFYCQTGAGYVGPTTTPR